MPAIPAKTQQKDRAPQRAEARQCVGALELQIHVDRRQEGQGQRARPVAAGQRPDQAERHHQKGHEGERIGHEDDMVIGLEPPPPREHQPHERQRDGDERPGEFIGAALQLVGEERGILSDMLERAVERRPARFEVKAGRTRLPGTVPGGGGGGGWRRRPPPVAGRIRAPEAAAALSRAGRRRRRSVARAPRARGAARSSPSALRCSVSAASGEALTSHPERPADRAEHAEHQEDREQEERQRRDEPGTLAVDVAAGEQARPPGEQRQGAPDLALEMEDAVQQIVPEGVNRAVDVRRLPAFVAIRPGQRGAAIEAIAAALVPRLAGRRLDGAGDHAARDRFSNAFDAAHRRHP